MYTPLVSQKTAMTPHYHELGTKMSNYSLSCNHIILDTCRILTPRYQLQGLIPEIRDFFLEFQGFFEFLGIFGVFSRIMRIFSQFSSYYLEL